MNTLRKSSMLAPPVGLSSTLAAPRGRLRFVCALTDDGSVVVLAPSATTPPQTLQRVRTPKGPCAPAAEVIACSADGALFAVASRTSLSYFVVVGDDGSAVISAASAPATLRAHLRGQLPLHNCRPLGFDLTSLGGGRGAFAVGGANGLTLLCSATDAGHESRVTMHVGSMLCACRFSDDGGLLALAAVDGRMFVRVRDAVAGWGRAPALAWCVHSPCERVLSLDFSSGDDGRWLALCGWKGDVALYDCAHFAREAVEEPKPEEPRRASSRGAPARMVADVAAPPSTAQMPSRLPPPAPPWQEWRLASYWAAGANVRIGPCLVHWCHAAHASHWLCRADAYSRADENLNDAHDAPAHDDAPAVGASNDATTAFGPPSASSWAPSASPLSPARTASTLAAASTLGLAPPATAPVEADDSRRRLALLHLHGGAGAWGGAPWTRNGRSAETALGAPTAAVVALPMMPGPRVRGLCIGRVGEPGCEVEVLVWVDTSGEVGSRTLWAWRPEAYATAAHSSVASAIGIPAPAAWCSLYGRVTLEPAIQIRQVAHQKTFDGAHTPRLVIEGRPNPGRAAGGGRAGRRCTLELLASAADLLLSQAEADLLLCQAEAGWPHGLFAPPAAQRSGFAMRTHVASNKGRAGDPNKGFAMRTHVALGTQHVAIAGARFVQVCRWHDDDEDTTSTDADADEVDVAAPSWQTHWVGNGKRIGAACLISTHTLLLLLLGPAADAVDVDATADGGGAALVAVCLATQRSTSLPLPRHVSVACSEYRALPTLRLLPHAEDEAASGETAAPQGACFVLLARTQAWLGKVSKGGTPALVDTHAPEDEALHVVAAVAGGDGESREPSAALGFRMLGERLVELVVCDF